MGTIGKLKSSLSAHTKEHRTKKNATRPKVTLTMPDKTRRTYLVSVDMLQKIQMELELNTLQSTETNNESWRTALGLANDKNKETGLVLQGLRQRENLTQSQLAKALGLEQSNVCLMEQGRRSIGKSVAKRLAVYFKTDYRIFL